MFDPYHKLLGIPPNDQPPNHYRLLGIDLFESDMEVIDAAAGWDMTYIRGCATGPHVAHSQKLLIEIAAARLCLLKVEKKNAYDTALRATLGPIDAPPKTGDVESAFQFSEQSISRSRAKKQPWIVISFARVASIAVCWLAFTNTQNQAVQPKLEPKLADQPTIASVAPNQSSTAPNVSKPHDGDTSASRKPQVAKVNPSRTAAGSSLEVPPKMLKSQRMESSPGLGDEIPIAAKTAQRPATSVATRPEVPSAADQEKSEKTIKQVFQNNYAQSSRPGEKQALSRKLLRKARDTKDEPILSTMRSPEQTRYCPPKMGMTETAADCESN